MASMRDTTEQIPEPLGTNAFTFDQEYLDIEQYKTIGREALMNIGLGFLMIAIVVLLLVANPVAAVLTFVNVASAIVELVGFMYFQGSRINSVTVIFLVIALGLAVDYSVHVAHGYLATRIDDPVERLQSTLVVCPSLRTSLLVLRVWHRPSQPMEHASWVLLIWPL
jgi:predicted RND superfamily exporter protein